MFGLEVTRHPSSRVGWSQLYDWGEMTLSEISGSSYTVRRTAELIARMPRDHIIVAVQVEGQSRVRQGALDCELLPGDIAVYASLRPYERIFPGDFRTIVVTLDGTLISGRHESLDVLAERKIAGSRGLGRVLSQHIIELQREAGAITDHRGVIAHSLAMLLRAAIAASPQADADDSRRSRTEHLRAQVTRFVDEHLSEADLTPDRIATALFVSVRTLHWAFAGSAHTLSKLIKARRLQHAMFALADPLRAELSIADIATDAGFTNLSYFSKAFKEAFDTTPGQYRSRALKTAHLSF
ncbi:helix-turn-helix domain-containing protein [Nocardia sp. CA2R105]|uniref:helix-turn-helix domain-containing protein n=1 Tax=Nocardia coffeae TaxID=2873381 RepID=UPI001CA79553|nr:helix-turn-helix domain-containing protein [Nocardia coffeae]MBY8863453.1 helix-turn-helix domain-containing protein [Nocardia coffeae]